MGTILLIAAIAFGIGAVAALIWGVRTAATERDGLPLFLGILGAVVAALLAVVLLALRADLASPTFTLVKSEWTCTASHQDTMVTTMVVGRAVVPQTTVTTVCDRYERQR